MGALFGVGAFGAEIREFETTDHAKNSCEYWLLFPENQRKCTRLLDSLSLSRHGESSGELGSVMILDPMVGNSLAK